MLQDRLPKTGDLGDLEGLWAAHVDLGNAFWLMVLPEAFWKAFRLN